MTTEEEEDHGDKLLWQRNDFHIQWMDENSCCSVHSRRLLPCPLCSPFFKCHVRLSLLSFSWCLSLFSLCKLTAPPSCPSHIIPLSPFSPLSLSHFFVFSSSSSSVSRLSAHLHLSKVSGQQHSVTFQMFNVPQMFQFQQDINAPLHTFNSINKLYVSTLRYFYLIWTFLLNATLVLLHLFDSLVCTVNTFTFATISIF